MGWGVIISALIGIALAAAVWAFSQWLASKQDVARAWTSFDEDPYIASLLNGEEAATRHKLGGRSCFCGQRPEHMNAIARLHEKGL